MNLNCKKAVCIITAAFTMMLSCSGCNKDGIENNNNGGNIQKISEEQAVKERAFKVTELEPDGEDESILYDLSYKNGLFYSGYSEYISGKDENGEDIYYDQFYIAVLDDTGNVLKKFKADSNAYVKIVQNSVMADDSGNISAIVEQGSTYHLITFDPEGNRIGEKEIPDLLKYSEKSDGRYINDCVYDSEGNIFIQFNDCIKAFDKEGNFLFVTDNFDQSHGNTRGIILTNTGVPAACYTTWDNMGNQSVKIMEIDVNSKGFGAEYILPDTSYINAVSSGSGDYLCYAQTNTGIAGYRADTLEKEQIINLLNIGVDTNQIDYFIACEDGSFVTGGYTNSARKNGFVCSHIVPVDENEVVLKKVLTLGCFSLDQYMRTAIAEFNRENEEYSISAVCYSDENSDVYDDYDKALFNFHNELISGNIPDILLLDSSMPYDSYVNKGLFADIYEFIDNDPEYTRDKFVPNMLSALERDGKLYSIATNFYIDTYYGRSSRLAGIDTLTFDKADELLAAMPEGAVLISGNQTRQKFISTALQYSSFVDYENGTCNYDSEEFKAILERSLEYPAEMTDHPVSDDIEMMVAEDKALLSLERFNNLFGFDEFDLIENGLLHEDAAFVGFPGNDGANGILYLDPKLSIAADSEYKEGAWEFIKKTLEDMVYEEEWEIYNPNADENTQPYIEKRWTTGYDVYGFPVLKEDLERLGIQYTIPYKEFNEKGELVDRNTLMNDSDPKRTNVSEDDIHRLIDHLCSVDNVSQSDQNINTIVNEEVSAFAQGGRSADETASLIQSRVSLYLNEQYS